MGIRRKKKDSNGEDLPMRIRCIDRMRTSILCDRRRFVDQRTISKFPQEKVSAQEVPNLRNVRILRSRDVWVDHGDDKRPVMVV